MEVYEEEEAVMGSEEETKASSKSTRKRSESELCDEHHHKYNNYQNMPMLFSDEVPYYCYSLLDAMPIPESVWSTTEPSIMAEPSSSSSSLSLPPLSVEASIVEGSCVDLEWGSENQASSSYSWWLGFLESLDNNNIMECPFKREEKNVNVNVMMEDDSVSGDHVDQACCFMNDWFDDSKNGQGF